MAVDHGADPFRLGDLLGRGDRAAAHEASAVGIEAAFQRGHLAHVGGRDLVVARLPEKHGRRIAEVDDGVAHGLDALVPGAPGDVLFLVAGGADGHDAELVAGPDRGGFRGDVHPADVVRAGFADQCGVEVVQPLVRHADRSPFVGGTLRVALQVVRTPVDQESAACAVILDLAESGPEPVLFHELVAVPQPEPDPVEFRGFRRPELQPGDFLFELDHGRFGRTDPGRRGIAAVDVGLDRGREDLSRVLRGRNADRFAGKLFPDESQSPAYRMIDHAIDAEVGGGPGFVADLGPDGDHGGFLLEIEVGRGDVRADGLQVVVQRQREVYGRLHVQGHVARDAALHGVEILLVPLEALARIVAGRVAGPGLPHITCHPARRGVVRGDRDQVFAFPDPRRDVESGGRDARFVVSRELAVHVQIDRLPAAFELQEILFHLPVVGLDLDLLPVEHESAVEVLFARVRDQRVERIVRVDRMRHADCLPVRIVVVDVVELLPVLRHALQGVRERERRALCLRELPVDVHAQVPGGAGLDVICMQGCDAQAEDRAEHGGEHTEKGTGGEGHGSSGRRFHRIPFLFCSGTAVKQEGLRSEAPARSMRS